MFTINDDMSIYVTRGDTAFFAVSAFDGNEKYIFQPGDIVRIKVFGKKDCETILMHKSFAVEEPTESIKILLTGDDTKFGDVISKPTDYWYEVELNPYTNPQTIIGFDETGAKIFRLYPEGTEANETEPEDIPVVDTELDLTSERPVQNQAIARVLIHYDERVAEAEEKINATADEAESEINECAANAVGRVARAEEEALARVEASSEVAKTEADRAKAEADRAGATVSGDFATNAKVDAIIDGTTTVGNADKLNGHPSDYYVSHDEVDDIISGVAPIGNANKLDGHDADYFAKATDLANYLPLDGTASNAEKLNGYSSDDFVKPEDLANYAEADHSQDASTITAGTFAGDVVAKASTSYTTAKIANAVVLPKASDPGEGGSTTYPAGTIIFVRKN